jgi:hypothetical protein
MNLVFSHFKPEDVKIFAGIYKNQCLPICNEYPYFPSLKDWTENQYGKVKHFRLFEHVRYTDIHMKKFVENTEHCNSF